MEENIDIVKAKIASAQQQQEAGNLTTAIVLYQEILDEYPNNADALHYLGLAYYQAKKYDMILPLLTRAIELDPTSMYMHENNLIIFKNLNLVNLIATELHWLASAKPNDMALQEQLITAYQQQAADYSFISAIGLPYLREGKTPEQALQCYHEFSGNKLDAATICYGLGFDYFQKRNLEKAIFYYRLAISYKPNYPSAHWNLSLALLSDGNFSEGWSEYEWRFFSRAYKDIRNDFILSGEGFKRWQGESLKGKSLLVIAEQGRGDAIQFIRFLPLLKKQKCRLILQVREELIPLFKCMPEIDSFCTSLREAEHCDYYFQLMSLTDYFKLEETDIIKSGKPYLSTNIQITVPSSERKLKVGFAYKGSEHHTHDKYRSIKPEQLLPLVTQPDCQFYSLQKETSSFVTPITEKVIDLKPFMQDFAYTAALIMQMDLIITVDTALAHVAGALGKPTWILISTKPDWRWMLDRTDSIWYPSVRLYRQTKSDSWSDVIEDIRRDLEAMVQER